MFHVSANQAHDWKPGVDCGSHFEHSGWRCEIIIKMQPADVLLIGYCKGYKMFDLPNSPKDF